MEVHWPNVWEGTLIVVISSGVLGAITYLHLAYRKFVSMDDTLIAINVEIKSALKVIDDHARLLEDHSDQLDRHEVKLAHLEGRLERE